MDKMVDQCFLGHFIVYYKALVILYSQAEITIYFPIVDIFSE